MSAAARSWLAPEVVQTSAMDCGPAALKCLLEGFGISVSYGRLREACQTDVDGTSIDTLEELATKIGMVAEQRVVTEDSLLLPESGSLPGLLVVRQPSGLTHFVVAWRVHMLGGPYDQRGLVQLMDPGQGRRWVPIQRLRDELYRHEMPVPAEAWREYAATPEFVEPMRRRAKNLGAKRFEAWLSEALADPSWTRVAALDAAVRMVTAIAQADGIEGGASESLVETLFRASVKDDDGSKASDALIPWRFWPVTPLEERGSEGEELVRLAGAVVLAVSGVRDDAPAVALQRAREAGTAAPPGASGELTAEVTAALMEQPTPTWRHLWGMLRDDGLTAPAVLLPSLALASAAALGESVIFRSLFEIARMLGEGAQRLWGIGAVLAFLAVTTALEFPLALGLQRVGRHLENRLRVAFLEKVPKLETAIFQVVRAKT